MRFISYNRAAALSYGKRWAWSRNPRYFNFDGIGGDCTNFVSQCIYAGSGVMNYTPETGWFYRSASDRTASWTSVEYLYSFLIYNHSVGPFGETVTIKELQAGDVIQLGNRFGDFYHSLLVMQVSPEILVSAHTDDALNRPLSSYVYDRARFIHINGVRVW